MSATRISEVVVAIPACNEAASILQCLASVDAAASACPSTNVLVAVAADSSTDATAALARSFVGGSCSIVVVEGSWGCASGARRAAVEAGCSASSSAFEATWIANTDADCEVPHDWLTSQLRLASLGSVAIGGIVDLNEGRTCPVLMGDFRRAYPIAGESHEHLHAANFGIRGDVYHRVGGWGRDVTLGEEHEIAERLTSLGVGILRTSATRVVTSSRVVGRAAGGFADFLDQLGSRASGATGTRHRPEIRFVECSAS